MQWLVRPAIVLCIATTAVGAALQQTPQQPSVFRSATNLVTVDAYPRLNGRIVEGLTSRDFDVLEDGVPQKIDQFEFVRVEPVPEALRVDPNTQREMLQLAADPHNRVVVTYLDVSHTTFVASDHIQTPTVALLIHLRATDI